MNGVTHRPRLVSRTTGISGWLLLLLLMPVTLPIPADSPSIQIITGTNDGLYERFHSTFTAAWLETRHAGGSAILHTTRLENGQLDESNILPGTELLVTIGSKAARAVADLNTNIPVLHTVIPASVHHSIVPQPSDCRMQTAIYIDQPVRRQLELAALMFPQLDKYGVLLGPASSRRRPEINALPSSPDRRLYIREISSEESPMHAGRKLMELANLFLAVNDPLVLSRENAKWLLYTAYQRHIPVIGFSRAYVKAGAAAAVYSEPEQMARQAAELVSRWHDSNSNCLPAPEYTSYFSVIVNHSVSNSLGSAMSDVDELSALVRERSRQ